MLVLCPTCKTHHGYGDEIPADGLIHFGDGWAAHAARPGIDPPAPELVARVDLQGQTETYHPSGLVDAYGRPWWARG